MSAEHKWYKSLTTKQKAFVDFYLAVPDARSAAQKAGYANEYWPKLMQNEAILNAIEEKKAVHPAVIRADVVEYLMSVLKVSIDPAKIKLSDQMKAADILCRITGAYIAPAVQPAVEDKKSRYEADLGEVLKTTNFKVIQGGGGKG